MFPRIRFAAAMFVAILDHLRKQAALALRRRLVAELNGQQLRAPTGVVLDRDVAILERLLVPVVVAVGERAG